MQYLLAIYSGVFLYIGYTCILEACLTLIIIIFLPFSCILLFFTGGFYLLKNRKPMKSVKVFLFFMLVLYIGLLSFDYLKAVVYPSNNTHHSLIIWLKTFFLVVGGILIMKLTLEYRVFKVFISIYLSLWLIYYLIKLIAKLPGEQSAERTFSANKMMLFYLSITQLITPFPFFFFWVLNRVFKSGLTKSQG